VAAASPPFYIRCKARRRSPEPINLNQTTFI
jgi:hypothetical protein